MNELPEDPSETRKSELPESGDGDIPSDPLTPTWMKVVAIVFIGIPLGIVVLAGTVLGLCMLGAR